MRSFVFFFFTALCSQPLGTARAELSSPEIRALCQQLLVNSEFSTSQNYGGLSPLNDVGVFASPDLKSVYKVLSSVPENEFLIFASWLFDKAGLSHWKAIQASKQYSFADFLEAFPGVEDSPYINQNPISFGTNVFRYPFVKGMVFNSTSIEDYPFEVRPEVERLASEAMQEIRDLAQFVLDNRQLKYRGEPVVVRTDTDFDCVKDEAPTALDPCTFFYFQAGDNFFIPDPVENTVFTEAGSFVLIDPF